MKARVPAMMMLWVLFPLALTSQFAQSLTLQQVLTKMDEHPSALVIGPTGLGLDDDGRLYIADTLNNRIAVIHNAAFRQSSAGAGTTVSQGGTLMIR